MRVVAIRNLDTGKDVRLSGVLGQEITKLALHPDQVGNVKMTRGGSLYQKINIVDMARYYVECEDR